MDALLGFHQHYSYIIETFTLFSRLNLILTAITLFLVISSIYWRRTHTFLVDVVCYRAPETHRAPVSSFLEHLELHEDELPRETIDFQKKVMVRSGIGNEAYMPTGMCLIPSESSLKYAMEEVEIVLFHVIKVLLAKHNISPKSIDILIVNCSLTCPTPSLASMIINRFGFRSDIKSFNLSGMGCSAGILSVCLARDLLKAHQNSLALILSTEPVCANAYRGSFKSMLLPNCLFRMGSAAILLSNRKCDREVAKYELQHVVRTHLAAKDYAYSCIVQEADEEGNIGVSLSRSVVQVAGEVLEINLGTLGALVLPYSEQIRYVLSILRKKIWPSKKKPATYVPNFKKAFDHFCIHAGGKAVIDAIKNYLRLSERDAEASKMTLYRFGNTSSSSTWYSLSYLEAKGRVKKGDKVFQLCFGSGFKCNSAIWKCISKTIISNHASNAWSDRVDRYPVEVPQVIDH